MVGYDRAAAAYENLALPLDGCPCTDQIIYVCGNCAEVWESIPLHQDTCCDTPDKVRVEAGELVKEFPVEPCPTHADTDDR